MAAHPPPVPPDQRSDKTRAAADVADSGKPPAETNLGEQGAQGNLKQNTTNQGHQQDR